MWPRLIAQLVDLLPHATRLLPMADAYFATRRENDRAQAIAIATMADELRADVGRVADSHTSMQRQIAEQKTQIASLKDAIEATQTQSVAQTKQLEWITSDLNTVRVWVKFGTVIIVLLLAALLAASVMLLHSR
jgi:septal ring factor EnvC (AmiA/AmiB activator)